MAVDSSHARQHSRTTLAPNLILDSPLGLCFQAACPPYVYRRSGIVKPSAIPFRILSGGWRRWGSFSGFPTPIAVGGYTFPQSDLSTPETSSHPMRLSSGSPPQALHGPHSDALPGPLFGALPAPLANQNTATQTELARRSDPPLGVNRIHGQFFRSSTGVPVKASILSISTTLSLTVRIRHRLIAIRFGRTGEWVAKTPRMGFEVVPVVVEK